MRVHQSMMPALLTTTLFVVTTAMTSGVKFVRFNRHQGSKCVHFGIDPLDD